LEVDNVPPSNNDLPMEEGPQLRDAFCLFCPVLLCRALERPAFFGAQRSLPLHDLRRSASHLYAFSGRMLSLLPTLMYCAKHRSVLRDPWAQGVAM
jgi:hypothetical protein